MVTHLLSLLHLDEKLFHPSLKECLPPLKLIEVALELLSFPQGSFPDHLVPHHGFFEVGALSVVTTEKTSHLTVLKLGRSVEADRGKQTF